MNDYVTLPISESIRRVVDGHSAAMYIWDMFEYHKNIPGGTHRVLNKIRTFLMTPPHGYRYTSLQRSVLMELSAKLAAALNFNSAKPYVQYEKTGSMVWVC